MLKSMKSSFRPQQGLTIMNYGKVIMDCELQDGFRPQQGLTIMNPTALTRTLETILKTGFRPQQGLTIMNYYKSSNENNYQTFPSPTGVNYYESD